jgi:hypothetical protein
MMTRRRTTRGMRLRRLHLQLREWRRIRKLRCMATVEARGSRLGLEDEDRQQRTVTISL